QAFSLMFFPRESRRGAGPSLETSRGSTRPRPVENAAYAPEIHLRHTSVARIAAGAVDLTALHARDEIRIGDQRTSEHDEIESLGARQAKVLARDEPTEQRDRHLHRRANATSQRQEECF